MKPLVIRETQVKLFKYWAEGDIHEGMRYENRLFFQVNTFTTHCYQKPLHLARLLSQQGLRSVVTVSPEQYSVWLSLECHVGHWTNIC